MLWEGLRLYSVEQYEKLDVDHRFILTDDVYEYLHPDIPEKYLGHSIIIMDVPGKKPEILVEGVNFLVVDDDIDKFVSIGRNEAKRLYPNEITSCDATGSSMHVFRLQHENDELVEKAKKRIARETGVPIQEEKKDKQPSRAKKFTFKGLPPIKSGRKPVIKPKVVPKETKPLKEKPQKKEESKQVVKSKPSKPASTISIKSKKTGKTTDIPELLPIKKMAKIQSAPVKVKKKQKDSDVIVKKAAKKRSGPRRPGAK